MKVDDELVMQATAHAMRHLLLAGDRVALVAPVSPELADLVGVQGEVLSVSPDGVQVRWPGKEGFVNVTLADQDLAQLVPEWMVGRLHDLEVLL